jgi:uncharacterized protein YfkK (UPF0435 family)
LANHLSELSKPSEQNMAFMIEEIKSKLKMAAVSAIKSDHFDIAQYEDILEVYDIIMNKSMFSISEMEAFVTELGKLRKK